MLLIVNRFKTFFLFQLSFLWIVDFVYQINLKMKIILRPRCHVPNLKPPFIIVVKTLSLHSFYWNNSIGSFLRACRFILCFSTVNFLKFNCHANRVLRSFYLCRAPIPNLRSLHTPLETPMYPTQAMLK